MSAPPVSKRSIAERVVLWGVVLMALWNLGRAAVLISQMKWVAGLTPWPDPRLRTGLAVVWAVLFFAAALGLILRLSWVRAIIPILLAFYGVYELVMMITYAASMPSNLLMLVYFLFVVVVGWVMWRPAGGFNFYSRQKGGR